MQQKAKITVILIKEKLFKKVKDSYDDILEMLYVNLLLYKERAFRRNIICKIM